MRCVAPCLCGGLLVAWRAEDIPAVVAAHNGSLLHRIWRTRHDDRDSRRPTAGVPPVDPVHADPGASASGGAA